MIRRSVLLCLEIATLLTLPLSARAASVWIEAILPSNAACVQSQQPNGIFYDVHQDDVLEVCFAYDCSTTVGHDLSINGGGPVGASCTWNDATGYGSCSYILTQSCGEINIQTTEDDVCNGGTVYSNPVKVYLYDSSLGNQSSCLPQCDSCQLGSSGQGAGQPVNVATGKLWYKTVDFQLSGPFGLQFSRWYDSQSAGSGDLGSGWRHNYSPYLDLSQGSASIVFHDEENRLVYFTQQVNFYGLPVSPTHDDVSGDDLALNSGPNTYTLTSWNGKVLTFSGATGLLSQITDRIGNTQTVARDASNRITSVTDILNRSITFGYSGSSPQIVSVSSSPSGVSLSFGYTGCGSGNLCSATTPDGKVWTYTYASGTHNLATVVDPLSHVVESNTYTGGKCTGQTTDGGNNSLTFTYPTGSGNTTTVTDGLSRQTTYTFDPVMLLVTQITGVGCGCGGGQTRSFVWDNFLRKHSETDGNGNTVSWNYARDYIVTHFDGFQELVDPYPSPSSRVDNGISRTTAWVYYKPDICGQRSREYRDRCLGC
jgi:hypothetical protein